MNMPMRTSWFTHSKGQSLDFCTVLMVKGFPRRSGGYVRGVFCQPGRSCLMKSIMRKNFHGGPRR